MMERIRIFTYLLLTVGWCTACMDYGPLDEETIDFPPGSPRVYVVNEGSFMSGTATLSCSLPQEGRMENEVFARINGIPLGDVAQSAVVRGNSLWVVVNNSGVVFALDRETCRLRGAIRGLTSPRYMHFVNDEKAYVTDLYARAVTVVNPRTYEITGRIPVSSGEPDSRRHPTEQMAAYGKYLFVGCWSYDSKLLVLDTERDALVDSVEVGKQPNSLGIDRYGKMWTITDGGYRNETAGTETPALWRIDAATRRVEKTFPFRLGEHPSELCLNASGDTLCFINGGIWKMGVKDEALPEQPLIPDRGTIFYGLGVCPRTSEIYVADAVDYVQRGVLYRFSAGGEPLDTVRTGVIPGAFCFD